ncbi:type II toxin-antitoxin system Phd/YefM family antitoxin [Actimicrobium sp. CCI2.3]|uniref:type II toxin-antitoxin system Phd/YefM family antitoxin n=1 Tax=Actimicrobium sp. CCI2.3 TaxID=3048616 RepID=UPI002B23F13D|nr:type II toxin-antitoxin system Phd/YefM family antitoxin [Actimicrobium sp. CCI2.3]MEB0023801.1 type II toxin-antitoxin system Phd/YefM family antitoxin [Actimicrobium sp. CCI2.3]
MTSTSISSTDFSKNISDAKRAAADGPVFITERGKPTHVLLSLDDYQKFTGRRRSIADALAMPGAAEIDFDPPRVVIESRPQDDLL